MAHLTSKHYQAIAAALATVRPYQGPVSIFQAGTPVHTRRLQWQADCQAIADTLERMASPVCRFDRAKWEKAIGVD